MWEQHLPNQQKTASITEEMENLESQHNWEHGSCESLWKVGSFSKENWPKALWLKQLKWPSKEICLSSCEKVKRAEMPQMTWAQPRSYCKAPVLMRRESYEATVRKAPGRQVLMTPGLFPQIHRIERKHKKPWLTSWMKCLTAISKRKNSTVEKSFITRKVSGGPSDTNHSNTCGKVACTLDDLGFKKTNKTYQY